MKRRLKVARACAGMTFDAGLPTSTVLIWSVVGWALEGVGGYHIHPNRKEAEESAPAGAGD